MIFNLLVYGFVMLIVGGLAWLVIKPKQSMQIAQQIVPTVQPQPIQSILQYARTPEDEDVDRKLRRIQRVLQQKYEAKADAEAIAEVQELLADPE
jgi:hypothetical protein